jgi:RNA polymerase sigma factor (sigma-70 family)
MFQSLSQSLESTELYAACRSADPRRQAAAYQRLWRYLYPIAAYMVRDQPDAEALALDCAQRALIRVHTSIQECREPAAFGAWARRIVRNLVIDELRRQKRLMPLENDDNAPAATTQLQTEAIAPQDENLERLIQRAPISDRSRRVVNGRYLDDVPDEILAQVESQLAGQSVAPSHIQVTRAKNIAKLRAWPPLLTALGIATSGKV